MILPSKFYVDGVIRTENIRHFLRNTPDRSTPKGTEDPSTNRINFSICCYSLEPPYKFRSTSVGFSKCSGDNIKKCKNPSWSTQQFPGIAPQIFLPGSAHQQVLIELNFAILLIYAQCFRSAYFASPLSKLCKINALSWNLMYR